MRVLMYIFLLKTLFTSRVEDGTAVSATEFARKGDVPVSLRIYSVTDGNKPIQSCNALSRFPCKIHTHTHNLPQPTNFATLHLGSR